MVIIDLQQAAALCVVVERKLLPAARQDGVTQPMQMQSRDADGVEFQRAGVGILQLVDGAGCRRALVRELAGCRKVGRTREEKDAESGVPTVGRGAGAGRIAAHGFGATHAQNPELDVDIRMGRVRGALHPAQQSAHYSRSLTEPHGPNPLAHLPFLPFADMFACHFLSPPSIICHQLNDLFQHLALIILKKLRLHPRAKRGKLFEVWQHAWTCFSLKGGVEEDEFILVREQLLEPLALISEDKAVGAAAVETCNAWERHGGVEWGKATHRDGEGSARHG